MPYDGGLIPKKDRYNTKTKAIDLENLIYDKEKNLGVNIKHQMDISDVEQDIDGIIKSITICKIYRDLPSGIIKFSDAEKDKEIISGDIFIDASEDGKLSRITTNATTAGRFDYPTHCLDNSELGQNIDAAHKGRQPAATLMFKLKGIKPSIELNTADNMSGMIIRVTIIKMNMITMLGNSQAEMILSTTAVDLVQKILLKCIYSMKSSVISIY